MTRGQKRKLEDDAFYSDFKSVLSVLVTDANTSGDMSLADIFGDHQEEEKEMEDDEADARTFSSLLQVKLPADREKIDDRVGIGG